jgi:lysozyme
MALQKIELDYDMAMEVASHEAIIRQAYKDSAGVWTWSIGLTSASGHNVERYIGKPQSMQYCLDVYVWALRRYFREVLEAFDGVKLTRQQAAAALSFHYNTGAIKRASWVSSFKRGDIAAAQRQFMSWSKPAAIIGRRKKEYALFFDGIWSNKGTITEYTALTKARTPKWSSARTRNVMFEMQRAFDGKATIKDDKPSPPPVDPSGQNPYITPTVWAEFKAWLNSLFS